MGIIVSEQSGSRVERELIPMDLHRAVCINVIDMGSHIDQAYGKLKRLVRLTFELPDLRSEYEDEQGVKQNNPRLIGRKYTMSLSEKANLRKLLQTWRKKQFTPEELAGFDISRLVGLACAVNVEHYTGNDGKTYAGLGSVIGLPSGMVAPTPEGDIYFYSIDDHGMAFPEAMPQFIRDEIMKSVEMAGQTMPTQAPPPPPPFPPAAPTGIGSHPAGAPYSTAPLVNYASDEPEDTSDIPF